MNISFPIESSLHSQLVTNMISTIAAVTAVLLMATLISAAFGTRRPAARHTTWMTALLFVAICIGYPLVRPVSNYAASLKRSDQATAERVPDSKSPAFPAAQMTAATARSFADLATTVVVSEHQAASLAKEPEQTHQAIESKSAAGWVLTARSQLLLISIWAIGCVLMTMRLLFDLLRVRRLCRNAVKPTESQQAAIQSCLRAPTQRQWSLPKTCRTRFSILPHEQSPFVAGLIRPRIYLPNESLRRPDYELRSIVVHELEHARRGHVWIGTLTRILTSVFWFHPLMHWMTRQLALVCEEVCDNAVLEDGFSPSEYASTLLNMFENLRDATPAPCGLFSRKTFERRLHGLLDERNDRRVRSGAIVAAVLLTTFVVTIASVMQPISTFAQVVTKQNNKDPQTSSAEDAVPSADIQTEAPQRRPDMEQWLTTLSNEVVALVVVRDVETFRAPKGFGAEVYQQGFELDAFVRDVTPRGSLNQLVSLTEMEGDVCLGWTIVSNRISPFLLFSSKTETNRKFATSLKERSWTVTRSKNKVLAVAQADAQPTSGSDKLINTPAINSISQAAKSPNTKIFWYRDTAAIAEFDVERDRGRETNGTSRLFDLVGEMATAIGGGVEIDGNLVHHRTKIHAPNIRRFSFGQLADAFRFSARGAKSAQDNTKVPDWVPASVSHYGVAGLKFTEAFQELDGVVDAIAGERGFFKDLKDSLKHDANGPRIDVEKELLSHFAGKLHLLEFAKPSDGLIAVELRTPAAVEAAIDKLYKNDPAASQVRVNNRWAWEILTDNVDEQRVDEQRVDEQRVDEQRVDEQRGVAQSQWVMVDGRRLLFAGSKSALTSCLQDSDSRSLRESQAYQELSAALGQANGKGIIVARFFLSDQRLLPPYRLVTANADLQSSFAGKFTPLALRKGVAQSTGRIVPSVLSISRINDGWFFDAVSLLGNRTEPMDLTP